MSVHILLAFRDITHTASKYRLSAQINQAAWICGALYISFTPSTVNRYRTKPGRQENKKKKEKSLPNEKAAEQCEWV